MKDLYSKLILILADIVILALSITLGYYTRTLIDASFHNTFHHALSIYQHLYLLYLAPLAMFTYEGIYTKRYDFWSETRQILKSLFISFILVLAFLAMTQDIYGYSRAVIILTFLFAALSLPLLKYVLKHYLYRIGLWKKEASIHSQDQYFKEEIFGNPYLGYVEASAETSQTIFIDSHKEDIDVLKKLINTEMERNHEVIFIPLINEYDLTRSFIYNLSSRRRNLIVFNNRLKSGYRLIFKRTFDFMLTFIILPFLLPIMLFIIYKIKKTEPDYNVFFTQRRMGKDGKPFVCYKFRTMYENSDTLLNEYLARHPEEIDYYHTYHKYRNDPRITKIGHFLRRTSLDELPQIFNIIKNEMSFIGPRPYMLDEEDIIGEHTNTILSVRPGMTGLWQVNGRNNLNFQSRVNLDIWYIRNWSLWMDLVILIKTIKTVLFKTGAY